MVWKCFGSQWMERAADFEEKESDSLYRQLGLEEVMIMMMINWEKGS